MSANPLVIPEAFDIVILAGLTLPGLADVGKVSRKFKWDKKEAPGTAGDSITYRGIRLVELVIELTFWTQEQIDEWDALRPGIEPVAGNVKALDVIHPVLERQKVRALVVSEIVELFPKLQGGWGVQIGVDEYKPPPKANASGSPDGSKGSSGTGSNAAPTAQSEQEKEIARLLAIAKQP